MIPLAARQESLPCDSERDQEDFDDLAARYADDEDTSDSDDTAGPVGLKGDDAKVGTAKAATDGGDCTEDLEEYYDEDDYDDDYEDDEITAALDYMDFSEGAGSDAQHNSLLLSAVRLQ